MILILSQNRANRRFETVSTNTDALYAFYLLVVIIKKLLRVSNPDWLL